MNVVEKVGAYKLGTQALDAARQGDKGLATQRLRQAATRLLDLGEQSLADAMQRQADSLENSGTVDSTATKRLRYDTRRIAQNPVTDKPSD
jgi:Ca-activated chloride channel family protein